MEFRELEGSLIQALFLHPDDLAVLINSVHIVTYVVDGERCDLLQAHHPDSVSEQIILFLKSSINIIGDFARTKNQFLDVSTAVVLGNSRHELRVRGEIGDVRN